MGVKQWTMIDITKIHSCQLLADLSFSEFDLMIFELMNLYLDEYDWSYAEKEIEDRIEGNKQIIGRITSEFGWRGIVSKGAEEC